MSQTLSSSTAYFSKHQSFFEELARKKQLNLFDCQKFVEWLDKDANTKTKKRYLELVIQIASKAPKTLPDFGMFLTPLYTIGLISGGYLAYAVLNLGKVLDCLGFGFGFTAILIFAFFGVWSVSEKLAENYLIKNMTESQKPVEVETELHEYQTSITIAG
jgi:hypothetical protein